VVGPGGPGRRPQATGTAGGTTWSVNAADAAPTTSPNPPPKGTTAVTQHNNGATGFTYNSVGRIDNEVWTLTPRTADGTVLPTFSGTAYEVATATGTGGGSTPTSVNFGFHGKATDTIGRTLQLVIKGVLRTDKDGNVTRFDWGVQSCTVR
jgi:hypothetical protein